MVQYCCCGTGVSRYGISGELRCSRCHLQLKPNGRTSKHKRHGSALRADRVPEAYQLYQEGWTLRRLAAQYGVTYHDVRNAFLYHYGTLERQQRYTCLEVARLLGLPSNALPRRWVRDGELPATPGKSHRTVRYADLWVTRSDLMRFLERSDKWMCWEVGRITDAGLRAWAWSLRESVPWRWLRAATEGAKYLAVSRETLETWLRENLIPGTKEGGYWYIRSDHADTLSCKLREYPKDWKNLARCDPPAYAA